MRSPEIQAIPSILMGWLLVLAAFLGAITDVRASVLIEHTHTEGHHQHEHQVERPDLASQHSHLEESNEDHQDHDGPESGDTHDHHLDLPQVPFCVVSELAVSLMPPAPCRSIPVETSEVGADGPHFELIKPPQIA